MDVGLDQVGIVSGSTVRGPDEGYTFGSQSVEQSGSALRAAGAFPRAALGGAAAERLPVDPTGGPGENGGGNAPGRPPPRARGGLAGGPQAPPCRRVAPPSSPTPR